MTDMFKSDTESGNLNPYQVTYQAHTTVELSNDVTAPADSFAWAIIQLNLGHFICRNHWEDDQQYLRINRDSGYIEERHQHVEWTRWTPQHEDMIACDWSILEKEPVNPPSVSDYHIVFDITPIEYAASYSGMASGGSLVTIETDMMDDPISALHFNKGYDSLSMGLNSGLEDNMALLTDIRAKQLTVTVDGIQYEMGSALEKPDWPQPLYFLHYKGQDVVKVGELLKQAGKTWRFDLHWHA
ncbi:Thoeris anti-defense Tad2 family protein [Xenorhabdus innexi]|uniref:Uncharacterized protein n=1 Tax=Xenorhabdus innexi TaxID=290109 RepID=A0A1N6MRZ9_9GAMM|nr:MW1434 family type I TA system toxin [Xenorhabdus innexi]PHM38590.1 hypothetical protein Xinn_00288 [Xenorhabdus innexi]SIP71601.1 hypothetical protein XIS1_1210011 [Xenorhabdus innexi]